MDISLLVKSLEDYGADVSGTEKRFCGNFELYEKCLKSFISMDEYHELDTLISEAKYEEAFMPAHTLKGLSGNLGLTPLYSRISVLVESLRSKNYNDVEKQYADVKKEVTCIKDIFENLFDFGTV